MGSNGYIKLYRKLTEWGWYKDVNTKAVFLHLLLTANYKETEYMGMTIYPGQTVIGRKALAKTLGLSERNIRTSLNRLKSTNEVTIKTTNKFSVVTIVNWESYQVDANEVTTKTTSKVTINRPASDHTIRKKEGKNIEREQAPPSRTQVSEYVKEMGYKMDADKFYDYYQETDWRKKNGQLIRDWKASVRTWERREKEFGRHESNTKPTVEPPKYKVFEPEPEIDAVQMPDEIRKKLNKVLK